VKELKRYFQELSGVNDMKRIRAGIFLILCVAGFFRLWNLGKNPPALFRDEAEKGYTAYSIVRTGGYLYFSGPPGHIELRFQRLPLFINVFGVYTSAIYQYCAAPFVMLGGLNEWTIRLPAALAGILTVWLVYLLVLAWTGDAVAALFSAGLLAVSPWHIMFSRWALQGILEPLLITASLLFFQYGLSRKPSYLILCGLFSGLAFYTYEVARVFVPLLLICLFLIHRRALLREKKWAVGCALIFLAIALPTFIYYIAGAHSARFARLSVFGAGRNLSESLVLFLRNYLKHYSLDFLFLHGDSELRHSLPGIGMMYLFEAPVLFYGLLLLIKEAKPYRALLLCWFFLYPLASALTNEGIPHALRSIVGLPMFQVILGIAVAHLLRHVRKFLAQCAVAENPEKHARLTLLVRGLVLLIILTVAINVIRMGRNLFHHYPYESAENWQYGVKQALDIAHKNGASPDRVFFSGYITYAPYLVMTYDRIDPVKLKREGISGLGYNFLPPNLPVQQIWSRLPEDSWLILYPWENSGMKPDYIIPYPMPRSSSLPPSPALEIFIKRNGG